MAALHAVAVIPARYASTRFPGKPLALLAGKPMIQHVYARVLQTRGLDQVWVATDDARIAATVEQFQGRVIMTGECRTGSDRVCEAVRGIDTELVLNVQGDEPLIDPLCLEALLGAFDDPSVQMATLRRPLTHGEESDSNVVKVACALNGDALYFSRSPIPYLRRRSTGLFVHVGVYAYRKAFLKTMTTFESTPLEQAESLEQLRVLEHGHRIRTILTDHRSLGVDTPEDLDKAARRLSLQD
ncbi:MAG: 3-deoxy-manno-octulosonate cytidylyltransferase [Myxococcales bacterium]|jgi:3-deoxy-manno-octulosonate cytidylyltransferase (CMP-KDO synthetase)|nr:3-deoxy-manno-octulosonate cytidylyltransferase [Myxococcales bacterium]